MDKVLVSADVSHLKGTVIAWAESMEGLPACRVAGRAYALYDKDFWFLYMLPDNYHVFYLPNSKVSSDITSSKCDIISPDDPEYEVIMVLLNL